MNGSCWNLPWLHPTRSELTLVFGKLIISITFWETTTNYDCSPWVQFAKQQFELVVLKGFEWLQILKWERRADSVQNGREGQASKNLEMKLHIDAELFQAQELAIDQS
jgi:hypothetical protein